MTTVVSESPIPYHISAASLIDGFANGSKFIMPDVIRHPEMHILQIPGFRFSSRNGKPRNSRVQTTEMSDLIRANADS
jgi:hypothetical protein